MKTFNTIQFLLIMISLSKVYLTDETTSEFIEIDRLITEQPFVYPFVSIPDGLIECLIKNQIKLSNDLNNFIITTWGSRDQFFEVKVKDVLPKLEKYVGEQLMAEHVKSLNSCTIELKTQIFEIKRNFSLLKEIRNKECNFCVSKIANLN